LGKLPWGKLGHYGFKHNRKGQLNFGFPGHFPFEGKRTTG